MASITRNSTTPKTAQFLAHLAERAPSTSRFLADRLAGIEIPDAPPPAPISKSRPPPPRTQAQHAHRAGPKVSRRKMVAARAAIVAKRESEHLARLTQRIASVGGKWTAIRVIPIAVWTMTAQVIADATGRAARIHLRRCKNRTVAGATLAAAFGTREADETTPRRSWAELRTRRIVAFGLALAALGRYKAGRAGPWRACVIGIPRGAFAALLRDPHDERSRATPSISACYGTHRPGATADDAGQVGYFVALRAAGAVYRQQLPQREATATELWGPSGYAINRYWIATDEPTAISDDEARHRALQWQALADADADLLGAQLRRERTQSAAQAPPPPPT